MKRITLKTASVILVGGFLLRYVWNLRSQGCYGMLDALISVAVIIPIMIYVLYIIISSLAGYIKSRRSTEFVPLVALALFFTVTYFVSDLKGRIKGKGVTYVSSERITERITLTLYSSHRYTMHENFVDWGCFVSGNYSWVSDTLLLGDVDKGWKKVSDKYLKRGISLTCITANPADSIYSLKQETNGNSE